MSMKGYEYGGFNPMDGDGDGYGNNGGGGNEPSSAQKKDNGSAKDKLAITPLTCKQFKDAKYENDTFMVDDKELHNVIFVGNVESLDIATTTRTYTINDGTGSIICKQFLDSSTVENHEIRQNSYVRVVGIPRSYQTERNVNVHMLFPIKDFNEVTNHILESVFAHAQRTKGPLYQLQQQTSAPRAGGGMMVGSNVTVKNQSMMMSNSSFSSSSNNRVAATGMGGGHGGGGDDLRSSVLRAFADYQNDGAHDIGLSCEAVLIKLNKQGYTINLKTLKDVVADLTAAAELYSTEDENHFKPTSDL